MIDITIDCIRLPEYAVDSSPRSMQFYSGDELIGDWWFELLLGGGGIEVLLKLVQELRGVTEHVRSRLRKEQPEIVLPEAGQQKEREIQAVLDHNVAVIQLGPLEDAQVAVGRLSLETLGIDPAPWLAAYRAQIKQREMKHGDV
jgi:hypothetical protein